MDATTLLVALAATLIIVVIANRLERHRQRSQSRGASQVLGHGICMGRPVHGKSPMQEKRSDGPMSAPLMRSFCLQITCPWSHLQRTAAEGARRLITTVGAAADLVLEIIGRCTSNVKRAAPLDSRRTGSQGPYRKRSDAPWNDRQKALMLACLSAAKSRSAPVPRAISVPPSVGAETARPMPCSVRTAIEQQWWNARESLSQDPEAGRR